MMEGVELKPVCVLQTPKNDSGMGVTNFGPCVRAYPERCFWSTLEQEQ